MKTLVLASVLALAAPAFARDTPDASGAFAVAFGAAAYSVTSEASGFARRVVVRRLGLDGGVFWEDRLGRGRNEEPVGAAVTAGGGLTLAGNDDAGCWLAHWSSAGRLHWNNPMTYGSACQARAVLVDANGNSYLLATTTSGGNIGPTLWKIDRQGGTAWNYSPGGAESRYAFGLTLSAAGDLITVTTATNGPGGWTYQTFDVDSSGRSR